MSQTSGRFGTNNRWSKTMLMNSNVYRVEVEACRPSRLVENSSWTGFENGLGKVDFEMFFCKYDFIHHKLCIYTVYMAVLYPVRGFKYYKKILKKITFLGLRDLMCTITLAIKVIYDLLINFV